MASGKRKIVRAPAESLREIVEKQLDFLAVMATQRLLEPEELKILEPVAKLYAHLPEAHKVTPIGQEIEVVKSVTPRDIEALEKLLEVK
jgi:hypothetical protein